MNIFGSTLAANFSILFPGTGLGGNVQVVQNSLGAILDAVESGYNAFNFVVSSSGTASLYICSIARDLILSCFLLSGPFQIIYPVRADSCGLVHSDSNSNEIHDFGSRIGKAGTLSCFFRTP